VGITTQCVPEESGTFDEAEKNSLLERAFQVKKDFGTPGKEIDVHS
jgi:hypothetical protein